MSVFHVVGYAAPAGTPAWQRALADAGVAFGFALFSALVTINAANVRADWFVALYAPMMGAALAFFLSLRAEQSNSDKRVEKASDDLNTP